MVRFDRSHIRERTEYSTGIFFHIIDPNSFFEGSNTGQTPLTNTTVLYSGFLQISATDTIKLGLKCFVYVIYKKSHMTKLVI